MKILVVSVAFAIAVAPFLYRFASDNRDEHLRKQNKNDKPDILRLLSANTTHGTEKIAGSDENVSNSPLLAKVDDGTKLSGKMSAVSDGPGDLNGPQDELTEDMLIKIEGDIRENLLDLGNIGGFHPNGVEKLNNNSLHDTISISELPSEIAREAQKDLEYRKKEGYDKTSQEEADEIFSAIGQISGTSEQIPNLNFNVSLLPSIITDNYQYQGYIYPYQGDQPTVYSSVKRIFSHFVDNSVLLIKEDDLRNGSATITTEFVNAKIHDCPAMMIEKRDNTGRAYGQLNWNTRKIGYTLYQHNKENPTSSLLEVANGIYFANRGYTNCASQDSDTDVPLVDADKP